MNTVRIARFTVLAAALALAACGKKEEAGTPLSFVPADTPFVMANREAIPDATVNAWSRQMQAAWPNIMGMYEKMLTTTPDADVDDATRARIETAQRVMKALIAEMKPRDTPAKWAEVGLGPKSRAAFYGIGLVPVMRVELGDPAAFRAMVARVETRSGSTLGTLDVDGQEVWTIDIDEVRGLIAIEGTHLVASVLPVNAEPALLRSVLGLDRPQTSVADNGTLADLEKAEGYQPYGSGWVDLRRIVALVDKDPGYRAFAALASEAPPALDDTCRRELDGLFAQMPRAVFGYTRMETARMDVAMRLDLAAPIAQALQALSTPPPGSNAPAGALYDIALSLPVLKIKDFLLARIEPVVASPYQCAAFAEWNAKAVEMKAQLSQFVPPPMSDLTGLRLTLDRFDWPADGNPDLAARLLVASSNPAAIVGMAQLAVPALAQLQIPTDGSAVTLPDGVIPNASGFLPSVRVAMNDKALALASGDGDLSGYLKAAAANDGQLFRASFTGAFYALLGDMLGRFGAMLPDQNQAELQSQRELYAMYATWIKQTDVRVNATAKGIEVVQTVEVAP
jgi:predicted small lipoprotein YifL